MAFVLLALRAEQTDAPTYDETTHLAAGYLHLVTRDYRFQVDHPPLAKMLAAAPLVPAGARLPAGSVPTWREDLSNRFEHREWAWRFLYRTPGNRAEPLVRLGRLVSIGVGVALLGLVWSWTRRLHGAVPALVVLGLGTADPNLLAHAHLVTPDVMLTAAMLGALFTLWQTLRAVRAGPLVAMGLCLGCGLGIKYTALLLVPVGAILLLLRVLAAEPWPIRPLGRIAASRGTRLLAALGIGLLVLGLAWGTLWATYGWRAAAAPGAAVELTERARRAWFTAPSWPVELVAAAARQRLLPDAWGFGLLYLWADTRLTPRTSYLAGHLSPDGWWYYFPVALALKVPLPILALAAAGAAAGAVAAWRGRRCSAPAGCALRGLAAADSRWAALSLLVAAGVILGAATLSTLNIGLRQVLPVYPILLLASGCGVHVFARAGRVRLAAVVATALLWVWGASFAVAPHYLAYFNELAGGPSNGARWLVDSNLDWGQALRGLPRWLRARGIDRVNLCYFGTADPADYGFPYVPLPGCTAYGETVATPRLPGYVAISATHLAGVHFPSELRAWYGRLLSRARLVGVIGHSIFVYEVPGDGAVRE
jgi:hypothetical protein